MPDPGPTGAARNSAPSLSWNGLPRPESWLAREANAHLSRERILPRRWWLNLLLFLLTLTTATLFGSALLQSFSHGVAFDLDRLFDAYGRVLHPDRALWSGLIFSLPLMFILLAHEFGHYFLSARRGVDASLPYFLPSPLLFGTFGAFIRIRSPIYTRRDLFDIGIAGPLAGFVALVPFLVAGVSMSHTVHHPAPAPFVFGTPLMVRFLEWICFPGAAPGAILLHPMAMASWTGLLATAFNLLPFGQLDGGHIVYSLGGQKVHRLVSTCLIISFVLLGFLYWALLGFLASPWWFWAVVMFFFGRRHPLVYDETPVSKSRLILAAVALVLFVLSVSLVPVRAA
ncbi:MAG: site-2 protease family protein [Acidobacteriia bacterium]|nr:site-2 protease family protein [Terriglobia bacterium]